jgi:hypothetical protein
MSVTGRTLLAFLYRATAAMSIIVLEFSVSVSTGSTSVVPQ